MTDLNWDRFSELPGDPTANWELLCRELVRRNYARFGSFRSRNQQPGIEFQLDIDLPCDLGDVSRHFGWQSRWYEIQPGKQIGKTRRNKIVDAIAKTEKIFPDVTDWVLWTKNLLTPTDQKWFYEVPTSMKLHLWTQEEVNGLMMGDAAVLRQTFFGDLILTQEKLRSLHELAVAPVRKRWEPHLHIEVETERQIKSALVSRGTWPAALESSRSMSARVEILNADAASGLEDSEIRLIRDLVDCLTTQAEQLQSLDEAIESGSLNLAAEIVELRIQPRVSRLEAEKLASRLRKMNHPASISVSAACWEIGNYFSVLEKITNAMKHNLIAVIGDAGFGKTFLGAQLTEPTDGFIGGVLLLAKYLPKRGTLDQLAKRLPFGGERMEELLESVDAHGARFDQRIPIVIDGLNESENPRDWKDLLTTLQVQLKRFSNCVVIVTLRRAIADHVIPQNVQTHYLDGFQMNAREALEKYFDYYKIDATDALLPWRQLSSPLFLKLFCEATNPERKKQVGVDRIPRSLNAVFKRYRGVVVKRIADTLDMAQEDVDSALDRIGLELWNQNSRIIDFETTKEVVGDGPREWSRSLARAIEEEGVITRDPHPSHIWFSNIESDKKNQVSAILYDAFAGFVIADAALDELDAADLPEWLLDNSDKLNRSSRESHPLAEDILSALVGLLPESHHQQLWKIAPDSLRNLALVMTTQLESKHIDAETVAQLIETSRVDRFVASQLFRELARTKASEDHALNAGFLDRLLMDMPVAERDLMWSEWIRQNRDFVLQELEHLEDEWDSRSERNTADELNGLWVSWMLTSSDRTIRDQATRSLYWFGLSNPKKAFELIDRMLDVNDPYVVERLLAVGYGVLMGLQREFRNHRDSILHFLQTLLSRYISPDATSPTNHWMTREYIRGIFHIVEKVAADITKEIGAPPASDVTFGRAPYIHAGDVLASYSGSFDIKFETDSIGRLLPGFNKYGERSEEFENTITEVRGRVHELGWRDDAFGEIDKRIYETSFDRSHREPLGIDRYVMKYARIGLQETAGHRLDEAGETHTNRDDTRSPRLDIDPSFPRTPPPCPVEVPNWLEEYPDDDSRWLSSGSVEIPNKLLRPSCFFENDRLEGPWLAIDGFVQMKGMESKRSVFAFIRSYVVRKYDVDEFVESVSLIKYPGGLYLPEEPTDYSTFAGESPWSDDFAAGDEYEKPDDLYVGKVGGLPVELLSHSIEWGSRKSSANDSPGCSIPSKRFSSHFNLRAGASTWAHYDKHDQLASVTLSPPKGCHENGNILFIREELVREYCEANASRLVVVCWGERNLPFQSAQIRDELQSIYSAYGHVWRQIDTPVS